MNYFRALYQSSKVKVRFGAKLSQEVRVVLGVRQGCPASSTLFNVFINDILDEGVNDLGVAIPSLLRKIQGLLFADDLVLLAKSKKELQASLNRFERVGGDVGDEVRHKEMPGDRV
ncbi:hypothetical protein L7F22_024288 [Adiantum nelumboides]|nr:hypothetical protein [Adiantum nelumboides]